MGYDTAQEVPPLRAALSGARGESPTPAAPDQSRPSELSELRCQLCPWVGRVLWGELNEAPSVWVNSQRFARRDCGNRAAHDPLAVVDGHDDRIEVLARIGAARHRIHRRTGDDDAVDIMVIVNLISLTVADDARSNWKAAMAQNTSGWRSVFSRPAIYRAAQWGIGSPRVRRALVTEYLEPHPGDAVLDIGCGTGEMAPYFESGSYTGFDMSEAYIEAARASYPGAGEFRVGTVGTGRRSGEMFDLAFVEGRAAPPR